MEPTPKKIHHKTLEAQKRREAMLAETGKSPENTQTEAVVSSDQISPNDMVEVPNSFIDEMRQRDAENQKMIQALADKLAQVENKQTEQSDGKQKDVVKKEYTGPRKVSYHLFTRTSEDGTEFIPIVNYSSMKKDNARSGLTYKNQYGHIEDNQIVLLTLADGTKEKVEPLYLAECEVSEMQFPKYLEDAEWHTVKGNTSAAYTKYFKNVAFYGFDTDKWWEIRIPTKLITSSKSPNYKPWQDILVNGK